ncbi:hypothetical protein SAMN05518672_11715 [Chitinophaga sp. CF118]|uniref:hypothetical protein n=1 Tax=Chitinophaga sp. CF118 TaxID=1884367 RepID=UPI0008E366A5|nr:hypothetical protein [Chitinophaga sp. CF118]SFF11024.1 hypothetical protein SAMN05518672_11715 [Chitinophaga sp. CF118]
MRLLLLSIAFIFSTVASAQRKTIKLETYKKNETVKQYKQLLITGEGGMQAKMYLNNLANELTEKLKEKNIQCHYEYLGDFHKVDTEEAFQRAKSGQYDAILRIVPYVSEETMQKYVPTQDPLYPGVAINADPKYVNFLTNDFDLTLQENTGTVVWQGRLKTNIDPLARNIYKKIGVKIIQEFTKNLIIPAK